MVEQTPQVLQFKRQVQEMFRKENHYSRLTKVAKHEHIYTCGDRDAMVYCIESGQVKELLLSPEGKECLHAIHTARDIFGELCLCGQGARLDIAVARVETTIRKMPCRDFLNALRREGLLEGMLQYLTSRISDYHHVIRTMATTNSEQRLAITLLRLAKRLGKGDPRSLRIEQKISHEELSEMVGTTRPRVCIFLQKFRKLGLIDLTENRHLIIKEKGMKEFLASTTYLERTNLDRMLKPQPAMLKPVGLTTMISRASAPWAENGPFNRVSGEEL